MTAEEEPRPCATSLTDFQERLWAEKKQSAADRPAGHRRRRARTAPSGRCSPPSIRRAHRVTGFKQPTEELAHDFLWRIHKPVPGKGGSASSTARTTRTCWSCASTSWCRRKCGRGGTTRSMSSSRRSRDRHDDREVHAAHRQATSSASASRSATTTPKRWKFSLGDLEDRKYGMTTSAAYEDALSKTSTAYAPGRHPANRNWFRDLAVSHPGRTIDDLMPAVPEARAGPAQGPRHRESAAAAV